MKKYYLESENNERNEVDYDDLIELIEQYNDGKLKPYRFGQVFFNRFDCTGILFPELYYESNFRECERLIYTNYKLVHEFTESEGMDN